jgi:hypothetical protein
MKRDEDQALGQVESSSRIFERPADGFMGAEYKHYLIPSDNTYKPHPEELSGLVNALVDGGYVLRTGTDTFNRAVINTFGDPPNPAVETGCYVHLGAGEYSPFVCPCSARDIAAFGEGDYRIVWTVDSSNESGLTYPLTPFPNWGDAYYELQLHVATDFVYHTSELIEPFNAHLWMTLASECAAARRTCQSGSPTAQANPETTRATASASTWSRLSAAPRRWTASSSSKSRRWMLTQDRSMSACSR